MPTYLHEVAQDSIIFHFAVVSDMRTDHHEIIIPYCRQIARTNRVKNSRDQKRAEACLERLGEACSNNVNVMPHLIEAASAYCTLQEMCDVFRKEFGVYQDPGTF